jgi:putative phage-type endonuclease
MFDLSTNQRERKVDWLLERRKHIGASDIPIILGLSKYQTPLDLWREKTSTTLPELNTSLPAQRGIETEPEAREWYEDLRGMKYPARAFKHHEIPHWTCSMDGFNNETHTGLEIKCPGKEDHDTAKQGAIPAHYVPQVEWQYLVTNAESIDYLSYDGKNNVILPAPKPTAERRAFLMERAAEFWHYVLTKTPPPLTDRDFLDVADPTALELSASYAALDAEIKRMEGDRELLKAKLLERYKLHTRVRIGGITLTKSVKDGAVDYKRIPSLTNIDLTPYRKPPVEVWTVRIGSTKE